MTAIGHPIGALKSLLGQCGYVGARLAKGFAVGDETYPLVGFAGKPWDFDSACIAVVRAAGKPEDAARKCRQLGTPVVWVCHNETIDWWTQHSTAPTLFASKPISQFPSLVCEHQDDLAPDTVYRAKVLGRLPGARQLDFVDVGLMPLLREEAGKRLGELVEEMIRATLGGLGQNKPSRRMLRDVFTRVFRLLAGKILKDKGVGEFGALGLEDPVAVLTAVAQHYGATEAGGPLSREWKQALAPACELILSYGNVRVVSPESLAYVYEHTLVSKELRKKLGIHATPPYLVDYIVWQLYDWIQEIPPEDRHIFEPACGHAPFLLAAMRLLRLELEGETPRKVHGYLKTHIHGVDMDDFALEIARLSLTLADIPNPNGWDLTSVDMYAPKLLAQRAAQCPIMLSNPPYEPFAEKDKAKYKQRGEKVGHKKAVEMLYRTLPKLPPGAVFGVVVPQAVLKGPEAREVREVLLRDFELAEICRFPGRVFEFAEMETAIILGRRHFGAFDPASHLVRLRSVGEHGLPEFKETYSVDEDVRVPQSRFRSDPGLALTVPALDDLWTRLNRNSCIADVASVGRGIEYKGEEARKGVIVDLPHPAPPDYPAGFKGMAKTHQEIFTTPPIRGLAVKTELIENPRQGLAIGSPQILVNRNRTARNRWRLKALLDPAGRAVKNNFLTVRPKTSEVPAMFLWAVLNSPIANAFVARDTMKRDNPESSLGKIPLPEFTDHDISEVVATAQRYRDLASRYLRTVAESSASNEESLFQPPMRRDEVPSESQVREALLTMDATLLKLYALPVRLERQLLDYFRGHERRGVGCVFRNYFPPDFRSLVPLHKYISSDYRRSTIDQVAARLKPGESEAVRQSLKSAAEAFGEDS